MVLYSLPETHEILKCIVSGINSRYRIAFGVPSSPKVEFRCGEGSVISQNIRMKPEGT